jgi:8-oxo-dGTP diphosphatase
MKKFNVRVYGIVLNDQGQVLVSDEYIQGLQFTKFPGGGLEWGEGTRDALRREFMEELHQEVEVMEHFYTTDYFQASAFRADDQLLSIYYKVSLIPPIRFEVKTKPFDFPDHTGNPMEVHRWIDLKHLDPGEFKWPVDKIVAEMLSSSI